MKPSRETLNDWCHINHFHRAIGLGADADNIWCSALVKLRLFMVEGRKALFCGDVVAVLTCVGLDLRVLLMLEMRCFSCSSLSILAQFRQTGNLRC